VRATAVVCAAALACSLNAAARAEPEAAVVETEDLPIERLATCGGFLEGAVFDRRGRLWVMDVTGGRVIEVTPEGECRERTRTGGNPNGARLGPDGTIYIADWIGLLRLDPESAMISRVPLAFEGVDIVGLNDLAFDAAGGIYFTVPARSNALQPDGRVYYRAPDGAVRLLADNLAYPNGVAVSTDQQLVYVSDFARKQIIALPAETSTASLKLTYVFARTEGGIGADGMLAADGALMAANFGTREVHVFRSDGVLVRRISLPSEAGDYVTNFALRDGLLYVTEARKGEIWRIPLDVPSGDH
jgi:gluconolactonase